jgi:hypothetical protein
VTWEQGSLTLQTVWIRLCQVILCHVKFSNPGIINIVSNWNICIQFGWNRVHPSEPLSFCEALCPFDATTNYLQVHWCEHRMKTACFYSVLNYVLVVGLRSFNFFRLIIHMCIWGRHLKLFLFLYTSFKGCYFGSSLFNSK